MIVGGVYMISRVYLDNCCFNRPYDDQSVLTTYLESEAKLFVQRGILEGKFELAWSYIMDYENSVNPYDARKYAIAEWRDKAVIDIGVSAEVESLANDIMLKGIKKKDALHIACSIVAECDVFLTTDKKILNKTFAKVQLLNPIEFVRKLEV